MPANTEGTDLWSWVENREAFRQQAKDAAEKLEECRTLLLIAVGNRQPDPAVTFSDETVSGIETLTQKALTALQAAEGELPQIKSGRQTAESALESTNDQVMRTVRQRAEKQAEQAAQKKYASRKRQSWIKGKVLRLVALGVLLATLFVMYKY